MFFLVLCLNLAFATASPLNLTYSKTSNTNLSPILNAGLRCTTNNSYQEWKSPYFIVEDCIAVIQQVYIDYVLKRPDVPYEFHAPGQPSRTKNIWAQTPAKWTVNTCTLAVVTLDRFVYRELPGNFYKPYAQYDSATFRSIVKAGYVVMDDCLVPTRLAGWEPVGKSLSHERSGPGTVSDARRYHMLMFMADDRKCFESWSLSLAFTLGDQL